PPPSTQFYTLSLHDALPISFCCSIKIARGGTNSSSAAVSLLWSAPNSLVAPSGHSPCRPRSPHVTLARVTLQKRTGTASLLFTRSEEHTSELQSRGHLVCRL